MTSQARRRRTMAAIALRSGYGSLQFTLGHWGGHTASSFRCSSV